MLMITQCPPLTQTFTSIALHMYGEATFACPQIDKMWGQENSTTIYILLRIKIKLTLPYHEQE